MRAHLPESPDRWPEPWRSLYLERVADLSVTHEHLAAEFARAEVEAELRAEFDAVTRRAEREVAN